jgi:hypothetical protein
MGASMRWIVSALLVLAATLVPASYGLFASAAGGRGGYALGTLALLLCIGALPAVWPRRVTTTADRPRLTSAGLVLLAGLVVLVSTATRLLPVIFAGPLDANRGDMLVIIEHAMVAFLQGGNPYAIHHVPWDAPLSYGPVLWVPYLLPHVLHADLRLLTLAAQLVVPAATIITAAMCVSVGELTRAVVLLALGIALALNPDMQAFHAIGQTQVYWPLLLVFALLVANGRWTSAAVCLGLLVAARTTMIAIVPVFFLYLAVNRLLLIRHFVALGAAIIIPFVPFVLADPASVWYAMFGVYMKLMKTFVWQSTTWAIDTYGITGRLLERDWGGLVEIVQVIAMTITYVLAWRSIRRGAPAEPWMAVALLVFSMTTLWSVIYLYFDVWILVTCALIARATPASSSTIRPIATVAAVSVLTVVIVSSAAAWRPGSHYALDIGDPAVAGFTGGGFGKDIAIADQGRSAVWIEGETARIRLPRAGWSGATIRIAIRPHVPQVGLTQRVSASLNGRAIGIVRLEEGWQEITFPTRARAWNHGFNVLNLTFSYAAPGLPGDARALSAAIDRIAIDGG